MGGLFKLGGQIINIWGLGDVEDVFYILDGVQKSGFECYQQGIVFIELEMIKCIEVEKGLYLVFIGNGGFGGIVYMEIKDVLDLLCEGCDVGVMFKYGYYFNDQQKIYFGVVFGCSEDCCVDVLFYFNGCDGCDMKLVDNLLLLFIDYLINFKCLFNSVQDEKIGLFKFNLYFIEEYDLGFIYLCLKSLCWMLFFVSSYLILLSQWIIDCYGYELGLICLLVYCDIIDIIWIGKYNYYLLDNFWIDL